MMSNVEDRQKRFENATCGRGFFRKREKKSSVFQNYRDCLDGALYAQTNAIKTCSAFSHCKFVLYWTVRDMHGKIFKSNLSIICLQIYSTSAIAGTLLENCDMLVFALAELVYSPAVMS